MQKKDLYKILEWLSRVLTCPICGSRYTNENTRLIESRQEKSAEERTVSVHTDCSNCKSSVAFNITLLGSEIFSIGMVSDLTAMDALKFRNAQPISADEIIAGHNLLKSFKGKFE